MSAKLNRRQLHQHRMLCLWLPNWPIQRLIVEQSELKYQRVVLFRQDSRAGRLVAAASPLALRAGIRTNMPLSEAKSLLARMRPAKHAVGTNVPHKRMSTVPSIHILPHDPTADLYAIEKLADELDNFSPIIGLQQDQPHPDCIFLDVTGLAPLFDGEAKLAQGVFNFCQQNGYLAHIAIADNIAQAEGIARHASDVTGPTESDHLPIHIVPSPSDAVVSDSVLQLPVAALRLSAWIQSTLQQLGIHTIDQLLQLPRKDLAARFGNEIHQRIDQLTGDIPEPLVARKPLPEHHAEKLLEYPTAHLETIEAVLERLIEQLCQKLAATQRGALQWTIRLYSPDHRLPHKLTVCLFHPTSTAEHIVQLARLQLESSLRPKTKKTGTRKSQNQHPRSAVSQPQMQINEISVSATSCVLITHQQRHLFDENPRLDKQELAHLINRLSGRLGRQNVVYPSLISGAQPERSFQMKPLINPYSRGPRRVSRTPNRPQLSHVMGRPLTLFQPAIALSTTTSRRANASASEHPPVEFIWKNQLYTVDQQWGPERIETGWWRGPTIQRDYWRIETKTQQQFWIYQDRRKRTWFLQGAF